jgi:alpha-galactosidase
LLLAFSDALQTITMLPGVHEETATLHCEMRLFVEPTPAFGEYDAILRIDTRAFPYYECLDQVQHWWATQPGSQPARVPEVARQPMYSTWYSFHQQVNAQAVEEQCRLAKDLGCEAVIVDDGWQTTDVTRGYAYTGDWEVSQAKFPDMKAHVARVHQLGMKYLLWYSVPFVGRHSKAYARFQDKFLKTIERLGAGILDPRYPEVRDYLITTYEQALLAWDLDGFKLDFVDEFGSVMEQRQAPGQDYVSVPAAVDRLLTDILVRLQKIKPDVLVEFRQTYIGPLMRKYGNIFRAGDCPNDAITNRIRTLNLRLLCGRTAAHADMLMWHRQDSVESAALQILNILFSVPQISVLLDALPPQHLAMLRYWLAFWREHRDVLLDGRLIASHPQAHYPVIQAVTKEKAIAVVYQEDMVVKPASAPPTFLVVNATLSTSIVLEWAEDAEIRVMAVSDCQGRQVGKRVWVRLKAGQLRRIQVPAAGMVTFVKLDKLNT